MRITGAAKAVVREIPTAMLINGQVVVENGVQVQLNGVESLVRILSRRYGAQPQEVQIHSLSELFSFQRHGHEFTDACIARWEILLARAENLGGVVFAAQIKGWLLLNHLRLPTSSWFNILHFLNGMPPGRI